MIVKTIMSATEETINARSTARVKPKMPILNQVLDTLSSVRFGIFILITLVLFSILGMVIVQQNVSSFESFYAEQTPAQKLLFGTLGLYDIYHSWYYGTLLLVLSLNIVLASIDRFPTAWSYISRKKIDGSKDFLLRQRISEVCDIRAENKSLLAGKISATFKKNGFRPIISEKNGKTFVFGERGAINRLGAYFVHIALLTLFLGHFVALQTGKDADVRFAPLERTNVIQIISYNFNNIDKEISANKTGIQPKPDEQFIQRFNFTMPFAMTCTDLQQKLIDKKGDVSANNTIDWTTSLKVQDDKYGETSVDVSLNKPFSYRGYRFFQSQAVSVGMARTMTLQLTPENGAPISATLARNGNTTLPDGTKVEYLNFFPDFAMNGGKPDTRTGEYNNPAAQLKVTSPSGETKSMFAFAKDLPGGAPVGAPFGGYKYKLADFEKVPIQHVLSIKYDPYYGATIGWYLGGGGLICALLFVFFLSHQRIWALIDEEKPEGYEVVFGGDTNRNHFVFDDRFKAVINQLSSTNNGKF